MRPHDLGTVSPRINHCIETPCQILMCLTVATLVRLNEQSSD